MIGANSLPGEKNRLRLKCFLIGIEFFLVESGFFLDQGIKLALTLSLILEFE